MKSLLISKFIYFLYYFRLPYIYMAITKHDYISFNIGKTMHYTSPFKHTYKTDISFNMFT